MFNSFLGKAISAELTRSKVVETVKVLTRTRFSEKSFKTTFLEAKYILNVNYIYKYNDYTIKNMKFLRIVKVIASQLHLLLCS